MIKIELSKKELLAIEALITIELHNMSQMEEFFEKELKILKSIKEKIKTL